GPAHRILRPDVDRTALAGHVVEAVQGAAVAAGVEDVDDLGIVTDVAALAAAGRVEELVRRRKVIPALRRHAYGAVVLLAAADVIRLVGGHADAIELCGRIVLLGPGTAAIEADVPAAVIGVDHPLVVVAGDPEVVVVAMRHADLRVERLAAVVGAPELDVDDVDAVDVHRVRVDARVVERALTQLPLGVHELPRRTAVVGAEDTATVRLDDRVHAVRVGTGHGHADLADHLLPRQAGVARDLRPRGAPVGALDEATARAAARHRPRLPECIPERRVDDVRILRIDRDVDGAGLRIAVEHLLPGAAAVAGPVEPTVLVLHAVLAEAAGEDDVAVRRMHAHAREVAGLAQSDVLPGLARVRRLVQPVARLDVAAELCLAGADIDHVGVRRAHRDRSDGCGVDLAVRDGLPRRP